MGFNISGILIKSVIEDVKTIETLFEGNLKYQRDVDFEDATSSFRDENTIDIFVSTLGTMVFTEIGQVYDLSKINFDAIQFINSDVADTYYFEKYTSGELVRKHIISQGEIAEDVGEGIFNTEEDLLDEIWKFAEDYVQDDFTEKMWDLKFKRYKL